MKLVAMILMGLAFQVSTQSPRPKVAPSPAKPKPTQQPKAEPYDPEHLAPGEVACGRESYAAADRCKCMQHRQKASEEAGKGGSQ